MTIVQINVVSIARQGCGT